MDNTRIHCGEEFETVQSLLIKLTQKIAIDLLPKYFPFLNPIELAFKIIKIYVKHMEIKLQTKLAEEICKAISTKMTPEICQKLLYSHAANHR